MRGWRDKNRDRGFYTRRRYVYFSSSHFTITTFSSNSIITSFSASSSAPEFTRRSKVRNVLEAVTVRDDRSRGRSYPRQIQVLLVVKEYYVFFTSSARRYRCWEPELVKRITLLGISVGSLSLHLLSSNDGFCYISGHCRCQPW